MEWEVSKGMTDTSEIKDGRFSLKTFCGDNTMCECVLAVSATSSLMGYCFVTNRAIVRVVCGKNGQGPNETTQNRLLQYKNKVLIHIRRTIN